MAERRGPTASGPVLDEDVAWIRGDTGAGRTIRSAVPAGFEVYALLDLPDDDEATEDVLLDVLVPDDGERVVAGWIVRGDWMTEPGDEHRLYSDWLYRLRRVEREELRALPAEGIGGFPDLLFPPDRSWFVSLLWDDTWRSIGASEPVARSMEDVLPPFERIDPSTDIASTGRELR